jgi:hypothetical protein
MNYTAANNRLHAEIDKLRYDKLAFKVASASVEKECKALVAESQDLEKSIGQKHAQQEEVEHECNAIRAESDSKQVCILTKRWPACDTVSAAMAVH